MTKAMAASPPKRSIQDIHKEIAASVWRKRAAATCTPPKISKSPAVVDPGGGGWTDLTRSGLVAIALLVWFTTLCATQAAEASFALSSLDESRMHRWTFLTSEIDCIMVLQSRPVLNEAIALCRLAHKIKAQVCSEKFSSRTHALIHFPTAGAASGVVRGKVESLSYWGWRTDSVDMSKPGPCLPPQANSRRARWDTFADPATTHSTVALVFPNQSSSNDK